MTASSRRPLLTPEQLEAALDRSLSETRPATAVPGVSEIGVDATLVLTLVPGWTSADWGALGVILTGPQLTSAVAALENAGYLLSGPNPAAVSTGTPDYVYAMTSAARTTLLAPVLSAPLRARQLAIAAAGAGVRLLVDRRPSLDPLRRWAQLAREVLADSADGTAAFKAARAASGPGPALRLDQANAGLAALRNGNQPTPTQLAALEVLLETHESGLVNGEAVATALDERVHDNRDPGDISMWIDAARPLAALLEKAADLHLSLSIDRAGRRLELLHRRRREAAKLRFFVRRDEQVNAIRDLVDGPDDRWALHLVGGGGVGKTMLLRYLSVTMADELRASVARVDFDFLTADYPSHAPGELLWNFEQELQLRDETDVVTRQFGKANNYLRRLHAELANGHAQTTAEALASTLLKQALEEYISALRDLPRVILVLDTCEELLRVRPGRSADDNIDATFQILTALHDGPQTLAGGSPSRTEGLPSLRVILAGRRPLAREGAGWKLESKLRPRPFLRLHPLRGFTTAEADAYLRVTRGPQPPQAPGLTAEAPPVPSDLVEAILERAPRDILIPELRMAPGSERRYSPYDLAQYADWASDDPPPSASLIRSATPAQYIERRILARLRNPELEALMPALAIVKHADGELLRSLTTADNERFAAAVERLRNQEWSSDREARRGDRSRIVYSVDERIRARLAAYYQERPVPQLIAAAADYLERFTLDTDIADLDWSDVDATLRALDFDPARAARWWVALQRRALNRRGVQWFRQMLGQLFSEGNAAAGPSLDPDAAAPSRIRPLLLASLASMTLHTESAADAATIWAEVGASIQLSADASLNSHLVTRAALGVIAGARNATDTPSRQHTELWQLLEPWPTVTPWSDNSDEIVAGAFVAAVEAVVERAEVDPLGPAAILTTASGALGPVVLAERIGEPFAHALAGRACALVGRVEEAATWFKQALTRLRPPSPEAVPDFELDWIAPADPVARIRLEIIRALYPGWRTPSEVVALVGERRLAVTTTDSDRLGSALAQLGLAERPLDPPRGGDVQIIKPERNLRRAHATVPPGFVTEAEIWAAAGQLEQALDGLRPVLSSPDAVTLDEFIATQRAVLRIAVRMRLAGEMPTSGTGVRTAEDYGLVWMLSMLVSPYPSIQPKQVDKPNEFLHQRLRSGVREVHRAHQDEAIGVVTGAGAELGTIDPSVLPLILDLREAELLGNPQTQAPWARTYQFLFWSPPGFDISARTRLNLRALALFDRGSSLLPADTESQLSEFQSHLGIRRFAEIAFDEGDALALRLPARAAILLQRSMSLFQQCDDSMGTLLASARLALIAAGARDRDRLTMMLAVTQTAWEMVRRRVGEAAPLVDWTQLTLYARTLSPVIQTTLPPLHSPWRPWALRIVACIAQSSVLQVGGASVSGFEKWLATSFGSTLPPDVAGLVTSQTASATVPATAAPPAPVTGPGDSAPAAPAGSSSGASLKRDLRAATTHLRDTIRPKASGISVPMPSDSVTLSSESPSLWASVPWRLVARIGGWVALFGVVAWGIRLALPLTNASLPFPSGGDPAIVPDPSAQFATFSIERVLRELARIAGASASMAGAVAVWLAPAAGVLALVAAVVGLVWALTRKTYAEAALAESASTSETERSRAVVTAGVTFHMLSGSWWRRQPVLAEGNCVAGGTRAYGFGAASELSPPLVTALEAMTAYGEVELSIPDGLGAPCWEGALRPSRGSEDLDIRRISPAFGKAAATPRLPRTSVLVCGAAGAAEPMVREAWTNLAAAVENEVVITGAPGASTASVVHLVGAVEETASGCVIEIAGAGPSSSRPSEASGRLRATDVRDRFPNVQLCVIQAAPVRKLASRRDATRRDANVVRWFAHDLHARGIPAVIVLPPTEGGQGAALAGMIGSALRQGPLDAQALMRSVRRVRANLLGASGVSSSDRWELSCDVCVYCSPDWTLEPLQAARRV